MRARARVALALLGLLSSALGGCDAEQWWHAQGVRTFGELDAEHAARWLREENVVIVNVIAGGSPSPTLPGATPLAPDAPIPDALAASPGPLLVIADDDRDARRAAARLVRAGAGRVAVLRGGRDAWPQAEAAAASATHQTF